MKKVITYGTYDLLHYGHIRLLKRAKALGDYLIVGVTSADFDKSRGKINVQQSLGERMEAVRALGLADEVIVEEYEGQKIDDICSMNIDVFAIGTDWLGKFDYLKEFCQVVYLERTEGVSSSEIRTKRRKVHIGLVGEADRFTKFTRECGYVNGVEVSGVCAKNIREAKERFTDIACVTEDYTELLSCVDAVYINSHPAEHYEHIKCALEAHKHVLCELPMTLNAGQCRELYAIAEREGCILMAAVKTAYSTAYSRLLLLVKEGKVGKLVSVDSTCTRLRKDAGDSVPISWGSLCSWGPTALLPVFQTLGSKYKDIHIISRFTDLERKHDSFTKLNFTFDSAVASVKIADGVKSEGELVLSGTNGYIYVPAPWWKTDYFEIRYEDTKKNRRYFYQLDGEGIRYEIAAFTKAIEAGRASANVSEEVVSSISQVMEQFFESGSTYTTMLE